jgi:hypothetical protein
MPEHSLQDYFHITQYCSYWGFFWGFFMGIGGKVFLEYATLRSLCLPLVSSGVWCLLARPRVQGCRQGVHVNPPPLQFNDIHIKYTEDCDVSLLSGFTRSSEMNSALSLLALFTHQGSRYIKCAQ